MKLLIDLGNSHLKWTTAEMGFLAGLQRLDYRSESDWQCLHQDWRVLPRPDAIWLASVGQPDWVQRLRQLIQSLWPHVTVSIPRSSLEFAGVRNAYRQPEALGVDRWLALLAAHHHYRGDSCVVDCGTAITLDRIDMQGQHLGGLIMPGLQLLRRALNSNTAGLPLVHAADPVVLADHTEAAIASGCLWAAVGLIETIMRRHPAQQLLLTGGDACHLQSLLQTHAIVDSHLVIKGLLCYAEHDA